MLSLVAGAISPVRDSIAGLLLVVAASRGMVSFPLRPGGIEQTLTMAGHARPVPTEPPMMRFPLLFPFLALALAGCAMTPRLAPEYLAEEAHAPYTLAGGDRLRVIVFGQDSLSNSYAVDGAGRISMPLIGPVEAQGRTTSALARAIEERLRAGYLREPRVSVEVEQYRPFFVLGEVNSSGQFPYVNNMTVQNAVAIAGGFAPRANRNYAELTRVMQGQPVTVAVPLTMPVRPGDTIVVKERFF
jgi:polysaccharide export outer membrane protein